MTAEQNESIAYEIALLIKENRELRGQCSALRAFIDENADEIKNLKGKIRRLTEGEATKGCNSDIKPGDKVVIHVKNGDPLICEGFVLTVKHEPYYQTKGGYMLLPYQMVDGEGKPLEGIGTCRSISSASSEWEKVDPSTPITTYERVGKPGSESRSYDKRFSCYGISIVTYHNLYGGKELTKEFRGQFLARKTPI